MTPNDRNGKRGRYCVWCVAGEFHERHSDEQQQGGGIADVLGMLGIYGTRGDSQSIQEVIRAAVKWLEGMGY